jgi:hypothetical protein
LQPKAFAATALSLFAGKKVLTTVLVARHQSGKLQGGSSYLPQADTTTRSLWSQDRHWADTPSLALPINSLQEQPRSRTLQGRAFIEESFRSLLIYRRKEYAEVSEPSAKARLLRARSRDKRRREGRVRIYKKCAKMKDAFMRLTSGGVKRSCSTLRTLQSISYTH